MKKDIITKGTIAIIGKSHILSSTGIDTFLKEELKENKEKIIINIRILETEAIIGEKFGRKNERTVSPIITIKGPTIK